MEPRLWQFLFKQQVSTARFQRRQHPQVALNEPGVVVGNVILNHLDQILSGGEAFAVITLPFQNSPEAFRRAVVNAVGNTGHALFHPGIFQKLVEGAARVLVSMVTVERRMCVRIFLYCFLNVSKTSEL